MKSKYMWLVVIILTSMGSAARSPECKSEPKCLIQSVKKMTGADCYDRDFKSFPRCLTTDVEVIFASHNRIRKLSNEDLTRYTSLTFLYLDDNLLVKLDDETFNGMDDLLIVDLSLNALHNIPKSIFQLPSLSKLFLSQNWNVNMVDSIEKAKPILSPLSILNMSFTTEESNVYEFPNFGVMPYLVEMDITGNSYLDMNKTSFVGMCQLKVLHTENVTVDFNDPCDCWVINIWLTSKDVQFKLFQCRIDQTACPNLDLDLDYMTEYRECEEIVSQLIVAAQIKKISIVVGAVALVLITILICILWKSYGKKKSPKRNQLEDNNLLNNGLTSEPNEYV